MGLDISSFRRAAPVSPEEQEQINAAEDPRDLAYDLNAHMPYVHPDWPARVAPLRPGVAYRGEEGPSWSVSYGGYAAFRHNLAALVGITDLPAWWRDPNPETPFFEILDFADNEGAIGSDACAALARDFAEWQAHADAFAPPLRGGGWPEDAARWRARYADLRCVFEWAADGGWVDFH